jgi:choline-sulfatase
MHEMDEKRGAGRRARAEGAAAAAGEAFFAGRAKRRKPGRPEPEAKGMAGMNVVLFITDQERAIQHFPPDWAERNLPALTRLQRTGVTFTRAFTNSCMCSPARATMMTGFFPAQHGVKYTLELDMEGPGYDQVELPAELTNVASVMTAAGYEPVYKGKWHLSKPVTGDWAPIDLARYGFSRWNPPDAGANQDITEAGGGWPDNDGRFMDAHGAAPAGNEGVLAYLREHARTQQPFFLVVSLVNPHDVLFYPSTYHEAGYGDPWLKGDIEPPATAGEDLSTKPTVQREFLALFNKGGGSLNDADMQRAYLNFYGNLMKASDRYLAQVLDALEETGRRDDTVVIRTSDHGEMGLAHGGLRQKNFNFYEESTRVPLVFSNPRLFRGGRTCDALVSHVDLLPTLASLIGAPAPARARWQGVDYSRLVLHPDAPPAQRYVVFTWDDWQAGQANGPYLPPPNHIVSYREERWKLAKYYDPVGKVRSQWEMYDLETDPLERVNLAWRGHRRTPEQERQLRRMKRRLAAIEKTRLAPPRVPA